MTALSWRKKKARAFWERRANVRIGVRAGEFCHRMEPSAILVGTTVRQLTGLSDDPVDHCAKGPVGILTVPSVESHAGHATRPCGSSGKTCLHAWQSNTKSVICTLPGGVHCLNRTA